MSRKLDMSGLYPVQSIPNYAVILRAIHERGEVQQAAMKELERRGLWLSDEQKKEAGLA
jgi:hypothetical protein